MTDFVAAVLRRGKGRRSARGRTMGISMGSHCRHGGCACGRASSSGAATTASRCRTDQDKLAHDVLLGRLTFPRVLRDILAPQGCEMVSRGSVAAAHPETDGTAANDVNNCLRQDVRACQFFSSCCTTCSLGGSWVTGERNPRRPLLPASAMHPLDGTPPLLRTRTSLLPLLPAWKMLPQVDSFQGSRDPQHRCKEYLFVTRHGPRSFGHPRVQHPAFIQLMRTLR